MDNLFLYLIVLRLLHISASVFWAGSAIYLAAFVLPAVRTSGPEGGKFMQELAKTNSLPTIMNITSAISVGSGVLLIWTLSGGFSVQWFATRHAIILTVGGIAAIAAFLIGQTVNRPTVGKIGLINREIIAQGVAPTALQIDQLGKLRNTLASGTKYIAWTLGISVILMSLSKYL